MPSFIWIWWQNQWLQPDGNVSKHDKGLTANSALPSYHVISTSQGCLRAFSNRPNRLRAAEHQPKLPKCINKKIRKSKHRLSYVNPLRQSLHQLIHKTNTKAVLNAAGVSQACPTCKGLEAPLFDLHETKPPLLRRGLASRLKSFNFPFGIPASQPAPQLPFWVQVGIWRQRAVPPGVRHFGRLRPWGCWN